MLSSRERMLLGQMVQMGHPMDRERLILSCEQLMDISGAACLLMREIHILISKA